MKKLTIVAFLFLTACQYHAKDEQLKPERVVKALQQQTLNAVLAAIGISGPHELISVTFFSDTVHTYAEVLFRNTLTGDQKNIIIQKGDMLNELGRTYVCIGSCDCLVRAVMEPNGTWGARCTCTDCIMLVYNISEAQDFFD